MSQILSKYSKTLTLDSRAGDTLQPYTFLEWMQRNVGIIPGKEYIQYTRYINQWNIDHPKSSTVTADQIKQDYIALLKQLAIAFKSEGDKLWISDTDFDNELDVEQAIPFYSRKLKEIALYLVNKREAIKKAKLKYNMVGAQNALEKLFYEYLLKAFTKKTFPGNEYNTFVTDLSVLNAIPEFTNTLSSFQIKIEDLYDSTTYFDRDPSLSASNYFNLSSTDLVSYLDTFNISPCQIEWLFQTGVSPLCADSPLLWSLNSILSQYNNGIPVSALETYDSTLLNEYNKFALTKKYLGLDQYIISGGYYIPWTQTYNIDLVAGNNWFYWVSGSNILENDTTLNLDSLPLSSTNLIESGATAASSYKNSDVVFTHRNNTLKGSWLQLTNNVTVTPMMCATIKYGSNEFLFPYPGYGIIADGVDWTGKTFDNQDKQFYWLDKADQKIVLQSYWNSTTPAGSALKPVYIYETTLADSGVSASESFESSDYIAVGDTTREYAWLYKMIKTDLPIRTGTSNIYWPFERFESNTTIPVVSSQCESVNLSSVSIWSDLVGAAAGYRADVGDKVYKLDTINGTIIEAAWLSGAKINTGNSLSSTCILECGCKQPSLTMRVNPNTNGYFMWNSIDARADDVFTHYDHQKDCQYLLSTPASLYFEKPQQQKAEIDYNQWKKCGCKAIVHSPLGHPGATFDDYDRNADCIVRVYDLSTPFDLTTWRGADGKNYKNSTSFAWFKLSGSNIEPDVGWGKGSWVNYDGTPFVLRSNALYMYIRSNIGRQNASTEVPYYIAKYKYSNSNTAWIKMLYDKDSKSWKTAGTATDMVLRAGDYIKYEHADQTSYTFSYTKNGASNCITLGHQNINFMWNTSLRGWDYNTNSYSALATGARPFWAAATDIRSIDTKDKGIDIWNVGTTIVDDYNFKAQPAFSTLALKADDRINLYHRAASTVLWKQPLTFNVKINNKRWCDLDINTTTYTNLSDISYNTLKHLIVSATNNDSSIILDMINDSPLYINYYANQDFTWTQDVSNTSLGIPPTGGVWIPPVSSALLQADAAYANLTNRHFPTYATVPYVPNLQSEQEIGGYFVPKMLGITTAVSKRITNEVDVEYIKENNDRIFKDIQHFRTDTGFTLTSQVAPVTTISIDSSWMKTPLTNAYSAGVINAKKKHQRFIPYQSKYETNNFNDNGVFRQNDPFDPWAGNQDDEWENSIDWPLNWRKQYPIELWYNQFPASSVDVYQWKTDIFGNQYALVKPISSVSMFDRKHNNAGVIWTRNYRNQIASGDTSLATIYSNISTYLDNVSLSLNTSGILDFDIFFDTLFLYTSSCLCFAKLDFDYDTGDVSTTTDDIRAITLNKSKFGGTWFDATNKYVTVCTLVSCDSYIFPSLKQLSLENNEMTLIYNTTSNETDMASLMLTSYDPPVLTYDETTKTYNISYIGYGSAKSGMYVTSINIQNMGSYYDIVKVKTIEPLT